MKVTDSMKTGAQRTSLNDYPLEREDCEWEYMPVIDRETQGYLQYLKPNDVIAAKIPSNQVWSVCEYEDKQYAYPGFHICNNLYYLKTLKPWEHLDISALIYEPYETSDTIITQDQIEELRVYTIEMHEHLWAKEFTDEQWAATIPTDNLVPPHVIRRMFLQPSQYERPRHRANRGGYGQLYSGRGLRPCHGR